MIRALWLSAAILLAGCGSSAVPTVSEQTVAIPQAATPTEVATAVAEQPLPEAVASVAQAVQEPLTAALVTIEAVVPPPPPVEPVQDPHIAACRHAAAILIERWEVSGRKRYERALRYPIWPGGASGITWGIGYDGGHQTRATIEDDWQAHEKMRRLSTSAGLRGQKARTALPIYREVDTPYVYAFEVFETRTLIEYERRTERTYRIKMEEVPVGVCAALVSLTYNRGGATTGDSRLEIRNIRDEHLPAKNWLGVASEIRAMKRLWRGTVNENGLSARRESEAKLIETLN